MKVAGNNFLRMCILQHYCHSSCGLVKRTMWLFPNLWMPKCWGSNNLCTSRASWTKASCTLATMDEYLIGVSRMKTFDWPRFLFLKQDREALTRLNRRCRLLTFSEARFWIHLEVSISPLSFHLLFLSRKISFLKISVFQSSCNNLTAAIMRELSI